MNKTDHEHDAKLIAAVLIEAQPNENRAVMCWTNTPYAVMYSNIPNNGLDAVADEFARLIDELRARDYEVLTETDGLDDNATLILVERPNGVGEVMFGEELVKVWRAVLYRMIQVGYPPVIDRPFELEEAMTQDDIPSAITCRWSAAYR